ncbi:leucine-rich repeat-containing protein 27 isoform X2 [Pezoporus occidentalis]|uniref:leucine-rich repeat-containing protein 27 isoform X2 n=1 Tax=Pezoporus occidentalis TaxID=407982 RepID=UPI002F90AC5C
MYRLPNIKYLHLEGNVISTLPEDLFQKLPHLVWLVLRYNKIKALPPGIGFHRQLKTLLLERSPIKELPAELRHLTVLTALNLKHCPLEFPPKEVNKRDLNPSCPFFGILGMETYPGWSQLLQLPKNAPYAPDNISYHTMNKRAEKQDPTPQIVEEWMLEVKGEASRSRWEKKLEQHIKEHTAVVKARGAGVKRSFPTGNEESKTRR